METSDGVASVTEEIRQAARKKTPFPHEHKRHSEVKERGQFRVHQKSEPPQQLGLAALGPVRKMDAIWGRCRDALTHCRCERNAAHTQSLTNNRLSRKTSAVHLCTSGAIASTHHAGREAARTGNSTSRPPKKMTTRGTPPEPDFSRQKCGTENVYF